MRHLFVLPTVETIDLLTKMFQASPMEIHFDQLAVSLGSSMDDIALKGHEEPLRAVAGSMGIWYDPAAARSKLILPLFPSPEMVARHREIGDAWSRPHFIPYMVIGDDPSSKRHNKAFINSIATAFVDRSIELTFCAEVEVANDDTYPADQGFYDDYLSKGALLNQVYLEEDEGIE